jgi:penicillin-binding protein 2
VISEEHTHLRLTALGVVVISLFAALFARLWYLQVLDSNQFRVQAQTNGIRLVYQPAPRGRILDRTGRVLVDNRLSEELTVRRDAVAKRPDVLVRLAALLTTPTHKVAVQDVQKTLADPRFGPLTPVPVGEVTNPMVLYVKEHAEDFPGVDAEQTSQRVYPMGTLAAHLLGYVGQISEAQFAAHRAEGYQPGDEVGKAGVELAYENQLRGQPGVTKFEVDSRGRIITVLGHQDPIQGHDVRLTVDADVQALAEESLQEGLRAAQGAIEHSTGKYYNAPAGAVVVLDPRDGSVVALASYPAYDPAEFTNGIPATVFAALQDPVQNFPLNNRATSGLYAPGSTFKLVTASAALTKGIIDPNATIVDTGSIKIGTQVFKNAGGAIFGRLNVTQAITVSSDVFFYTLGANFWNARRQYGLAIQDMARQYGLGAPTGIAIGGEASGAVPDPASRRRLHEQNPVAFPNGQWFTGDNVNLAIGQGELLVTPLQLANAYATFANGGTLYQPRMAVEVQNQDGTKVSDLPPRALRTINFPPGTHDAMLQGFEGVVQSASGTANGAFHGFPLSQVSVAGKTGTAQVSGKQDTSVFVSWAPADKPQYLVGVVEEEAGFGTSAAAPTARRILEGVNGLTPGPVNYIPSLEANNR